MSAMPASMSAIADALRACGAVDEKNRIRGCTASEVDEVQRQAPGRLPRAYCDFLRAMGHAAGRLFVGSDVFFFQIRDLKLGAEEVLRENSAPCRLPEEAFVFMMHQGYVFYFFRCDAGDDPPVYEYREGRNTIERITDRFSQFIMENVDDLRTIINLRSELRSKRPQK